MIEFDKLEAIGNNIHNPETKIKAIEMLQHHLLNCDKDNFETLMNYRNNYQAVVANKMIESIEEKLKA